MHDTDWIFLMLCYVVEYADVCVLQKMASMGQIVAIGVALLAILSGQMAVQPGRYAVCLVPDGKYGCKTDRKITKDCCAAVANGEHGWGPAHQGYDEATYQCEGVLGFGNGVNVGDVVKCCATRGATCRT